MRAVLAVSLLPWVAAVAVVLAGSAVLGGGDGARDSARVLLASAWLVTPVLAVLLTVAAVSSGAARYTLVSRSSFAVTELLVALVAFTVGGVLAAGAYGVFYAGLWFVVSGYVAFAFLAGARSRLVPATGPGPRDGEPSSLPPSRGPRS